MLFLCLIARISWKHGYSPFDILKGILQSEGHTTQASGRQFLLTAGTPVSLQVALSSALEAETLDRLIDTAGCWPFGRRHRTGQRRHLLHICRLPRPKAQTLKEWLELLTWRSKWPLARYFSFVGRVLLALLFILDAYLPKIPVHETATANLPIIRIHSDRALFSIPAFR